jgi:hypothetical protein
MPEWVDAFQIGKRADIPASFDEQPRFASDHIYLVSFLVCSGHIIIGTSSKGTRVSFEFKKTPDLLADVARFMSGAMVPARQFSFEILKLKRTIHGGQ